MERVGQCGLIYACKMGYKSQEVFEKLPCAKDILRSHSPYRDEVGLWGVAQNFRSLFYAHSVHI